MGINMSLLSEEQAQASEEFEHLETYEILLYGSFHFLSHSHTEKKYLVKEFQFEKANSTLDPDQFFSRLENPYPFLLPLISGNIIDSEDFFEGFFMFEAFDFEANLANEIAEKKGVPYSEEQLWKILDSVVKILDYMNQKQEKSALCLTPHHIYIINNEYKLIDFEDLTDLINNLDLTDVPMLFYQSPHLLQALKEQEPININEKDNIFSLGITILEAALLQHPLDLDGDDVSFEDLGPSIDKLRNKYSPDFVEIIKSMVNLQEEQRISLQALCQEINRVDRLIETPKSFKQKDELFGLGKSKINTGISLPVSKEFQFSNPNPFTQKTVKNMILQVKEHESEKNTQNPKTIKEEEESLHLKPQNKPSDPHSGQEIYYLSSEILPKSQLLESDSVRPKQTFEDYRVSIQSKIERKSEESRPSSFKPQHKSEDINIEHRSEDFAATSYNSNYIEKNAATTTINRSFHADIANTLNESNRLNPVNYGATTNYLNIIDRKDGITASYNTISENKTAFFREGTSSFQNTIPYASNYNNNEYINAGYTKTNSNVTVSYRIEESDSIFPSNRPSENIKKGGFPADVNTMSPVHNIYKEESQRNSLHRSKIQEEISEKIMKSTDDQHFVEYKSPQKNEIEEKKMEFSGDIPTFGNRNFEEPNQLGSSFHSPVTNYTYSIYGHPLSSIYKSDEGVIKENFFENQRTPESDLYKLTSSIESKTVNDLEKYDNYEKFNKSYDEYNSLNLYNVPDSMSYYVKKENNQQVVDPTNNRITADSNNYYSFKNIEYQTKQYNINSDDLQKKDQKFDDYANITYNYSHYQSPIYIQETPAKASLKIEENPDKIFISSSFNQKPFEESRYIEKTPDKNYLDINKIYSPSQNIQSTYSSEKSFLKFKELDEEYQRKSMMLQEKKKAVDKSLDFLRETCNFLKQNRLSAII